MNCFNGSSAENNYAVEKRLEAFPAIIPQKHPTPFKSEQQAGYIKTLMFFWCIHCFVCLDVRTTNECCCIDK